MHLNKLLTRCSVLLIVCLLCGAAYSSRAQTAPQCGYARAFQFPVDRAAFVLVQDFAAPSLRHQGRYHTGEDWTLAAGDTYGQPVRAAADGRVTFSSANGWGRDGGVIILEHALEDGSRFYSQYGHLTDATGITFPPVFGCVQMGEILAAIGDPRPAPHLHFEIRTNTPDLPGPGYTWEDPQTLGLRRPSKFILNQALWLNDAHAWHLDLADETGPQSPPVVLGDTSLLYLDADRVARVSGDGRVLWRTNLPESAAGLFAAGEAGAVVYRSGRVQPIDTEGALGTAVELGFAVQGAVSIESSIYLHSADNRLIALNAELLTPIWSAADVGEIIEVLAVGDTLAALTRDALGGGQLVVLRASTGERLDLARLAEPGALVTGAAGGFVAYTRGGAWRIDGAGIWSLLLPDAPPGGQHATIAEAADGGLFLYNDASLYAYAADGSARWSVDAPDTDASTTAPASLDVYGDVLLLITGDGQIAAYDAAAGGLCNETRLWADWRAHLWHALGSDGLLRVAAADQIAALDWELFLLACAE